MIRVTCSCGSRLEVKDRAIGRSVKCPACGRPVRVQPPDEPTYDLSADDGPPAPVAVEVGAPVGGDRNVFRAHPADDAPAAAAPDPFTPPPVRAASFARACPSVLAYVRCTVLHSIAALISILIILLLYQASIVMLSFFYVLIPAVRIILPLLVLALIGGYLLAHGLEIVGTSARGEDDVPPNPLWDRATLSYGLGRGLLLGAAYVGPGLAIVGLCARGLAPGWLRPAGVGLLSLGVFCLPMAAIGMATTAWQHTLRYDRVLVAALRHLPAYLLLWAMCAAGLSGAAVVLGLVVSGPLAELGAAGDLFVSIVWWVLFILGGYVAARSIGLFGRYYAHDLPFDLGEPAS